MKKGLFVSSLLPLLVASASVLAQTPSFSFQGRLLDGGQPANGNYDLRFTLMDAATNGYSVAGPLTNAPVVVTNRHFAVMLSFIASVFDGTPLWLEIGVRTNGSTGAYTALAPRQAIAATPYAIFADSSGIAAMATTVQPGATPTLNGAGVTNLNGGNIRAGTINSNALDAATRAQLALAGTAISDMSVHVELQGTFVGDMLPDQSMNLDKLSGFWNTVAAKARPVKVLIITDYSAYTEDFPGVAFEGALASILGANGGLNATMNNGGPTAPGTMSFFCTGGSYDSFAAVWPFSAYVRDITNGATILWGGSNSTTSLLATKAVVLYVAETNAGSFFIQTNLTGTWGTYTNINAAGYGTNVVAVTLPLVKGNYQMQAVGQTGTVRIVGVGLWDDTSPGVRFTSLFTSGQSLYSVVGSPTNTWWPVFTALDPDLIIIEDGDQGLAARGTDLGPIYFGPWEQMLTNCCPHANVMWLGVHHLDYPAYCGITNQEEAYNAQVVVNAAKYNWMYWDPDPTFGTNTAWMVRLGLLSGDGVHPSVQGAAWMNRRLFNSLIQTKAYANQLGNGPPQLSQLPGITTNVVCGSRTLLITNGIIMGVQ